MCYVCLIPKVLTIDSYDRHLSGFWLGAIGAVVRVPQANCNDIQNRQKSGLRWPKIARRTSLRPSDDAPHHPSGRALPVNDFGPSYGSIVRTFGIMPENRLPFFANALYSGQTSRIIGIATAMTMISSGRPMRQ